MHSKLTKIANMRQIIKYRVPEKEEFYADCEYSDSSKMFPTKVIKKNIEKNAKFEKLKICVIFYCNFFQNIF
jgi:hypothetical protein